MPFTIFLILRSAERRVSKDARSSCTRLSKPSLDRVLAAEAVAPALEMADRWRWEVHRAEQRLGVAITLEKAAAGPDGLFRVGIGAREERGIARLQRRMDQIAGEHRGVALAPDRDGEMVRRVAGGRKQPDVVVERMVAGDQLGL